MTQPLTSIPQPSTQQPGRRVAWPRYAHTHPARLLGTHENEQALSRPPSPPCGRRAGVTVKLQSIQASKHQARRWNFSEGAERSVQNSSVQMHVGHSYLTQGSYGYGALHAISYDIRPPTPSGWTLYESATVQKAPKNRPEPSWGSSAASPNQPEWNAEPLAREAKAGFNTTFQPTRPASLPSSLRLWSIVALYSVVPLSSTHLCLQGRRSRLKSPSLLTLHALRSVRHNYFGFRFNSATKDRHDICTHSNPLYV
ncbi:hypothetical protein CMEL01_16102 [Colletotrichum melonis]|uniref:PKD domain-containing protein n=1 Tax=Colletotrichum melonis TaxID=1209925 RepID=A0AAI9UJF7_9PEZI|nr:hypothetical protein CMEL01_16102 [Colletotrichum melonis]